MEIKSAHFIKGIRGTDEITDKPLPHIAFLGRSNVGKSSTINMLAGRNNLVKSSSTPGKTKEINFFLMNDEFYFVDLPGYGYAKVSKTERDKLRKLILWYMRDTYPEERLFVLVIDAQVGITEHDEEILDIAAEKGETVVLAVNKSDKLNQKKKHALNKQMEEFGHPYALVSATNGKGKEALYSLLFE